MAPSLGRRNRERALPRLFRNLFVGAVGAWALVASGVVPATPGGVLRAGALALAVFAVLTALRFVPASRSLAGIVRGVEFVAFVAAVVAVAVDLSLLGLSEWKPSTLWLPASASPAARIAAFREQPGLVRLGFPCNSLGFYDDEPPTGGVAPWIACIGDSFVVSAVPQPLHFSTVAEALLEEPIQCFGVPATGPLEYRELLEHEVLPRRPTSVLLVIFASNDVTDCERLERSWFERCFDPADAPLFFIWKRLALQQRGGQCLPPRSRGHVEGDTIYIESALGPGHASRAQLVASLPKLAPGLLDPSQQHPLFTEDEFLDIERSLAGQVCSPTSRAWAGFFAAMDELLAVAGSIPVRVLLIPDQFQVDDELWARIAASDPGLDRDLPQRRIVEFLGRRAIPVLDVLPALRAAAARGERTYLIRDTHLDRVGNDVVGRELAAFLTASR